MRNDETARAASVTSSDERRKAKAFRDALATMVREHGLAIFSDEVIQRVEALLPEGTCTECYAVPEPYDGPGVPIRPIGRMHHGWCPTVPRLSPEQRADLNRRLDELARARRRALTDSHNVVVGDAQPKVSTPDGEPS